MMWMEYGLGQVMWIQGLGVEEEEGESGLATPWTHMGNKGMTGADKGANAATVNGGREETRAFEESLGGSKCQFDPDTILSFEFSAYITSNILKKPNPLTLLICIPGAGPHPNDPNIGKPPCCLLHQSYECAGKFLLALLKHLQDSKLHLELNKVKQDVLADSLLNAWDSYSCGLWPYTGYDGATVVLDWWWSLSKIPSAEILAVGG
ncbi:hypothetical protein BS47DRAFT_1403530 [Hydnum rufescens UP504]|uniref:Uncharacterized protein n=1 Tax=Hydnum rufescens UP504 TaxID=1448309 RepID=A0A9P6BB64_9AGAM|nr:hypothetical protein BS47DRAFT_1403530 [Hydnum rufescens UP504]